MYQPLPSFLNPQLDIHNFHSLDHLESLFLFGCRVVVRVGRGSELPIRDFWGGVKGREFKESRVCGQENTSEKEWCQRVCGDIEVEYGRVYLLNEGDLEREKARGVARGRL
jgi:hypothetical protein